MKYELLTRIEVLFLNNNILATLIDKFSKYRYSGYRKETLKLILYFFLLYEILKSLVIVQLTNIGL